MASESDKLGTTSTKIASDYAFYPISGSFKRKIRCDCPDNECSMLEAGIQEFFAEGGITPLNIFYEDFIQNYEQTVRTILDYLELASKSVTIAPPALTKIAKSPR